MPRVWRNGTLSSHIYSGPHHEFNDWISSWMWEERIQFLVLLKYLRIIC